MTEEEMVAWHHRLNEHQFEQTLEDGEGQGSLACRSLGSQRVGHNSATEQQQEDTENQHSGSLLHLCYSL